MGMYSSALISYGVDVGDKFEGKKIGKIIRKKVGRYLGYDDYDGEYCHFHLDYDESTKEAFEETQEWLGDAGGYSQYGNFYHGTNNGIILTCLCHTTDHTSSIEPEDMVVSEEAHNKMVELCDILGIEGEPKWHLSKLVS